MFSPLRWLVALTVLGMLTVVSVRADDPAAPPISPAPASSPAGLPTSAQIRNVQFDLLLRPRDANNKDGTPLVLYPAQPWRCMTWTVASTPDGLISLKNRFTSKTFATTADGSIKQILFDAAKTWKFEKLADGNYRILDPAAPGKALTAKNVDSLGMDDWKDTPNQKWEVLTAPAHLTM